MILLIKANMDIISIFGNYYHSYVKYIDLKNVNIKEIPKEIQYLTQLTKLDLSFNIITKIPKEIQYLTQLTELYLTINKIITIPKEIQYLTQLTVLNLGMNNIEVIPKEIQYLTQLTRFSVSANNIVVVPKEIQYLTHLTELNLSQNKIKEIPEEIQYLTQLTILDLSINQIQSIPIQMTQLINLREFECHNNPIEYIPPNVQRFLNIIINNGGNIHNIYNDGQNVHNSSINKSIKQSIENLLALNTSKFNLNYLNDTILTTNTKEALVEYCEDKSIHSILNVTFDEVLKQIMFHILSFDQKTQEEIKKRMNEEMLDAQCKCFTGRLSRLVNVLSGYSELVTIHISEAEEIGNIISINREKYGTNLEELKKTVVNELKERGYDDEIIDEWIKYIE